MRETVTRRPTKTLQSLVEGLSSKGNKGSTRRKLANYSWPKATGVHHSKLQNPSLFPNPQNPFLFTSTFALTYHQMDFTVSKMVEETKESRIGEDAITVGKSNRP